MATGNSNCLLCFKNCEGDLLIFNKSADYFKRLFDSCVKHLHSKIKSRSFQLNPSESNNQPFCSTCLDLADKLFQIDEQLENLTKSLANHIEYFDEKILNARKSNRENEIPPVEDHQLSDNEIGDNTDFTDERGQENENVESDKSKVAYNDLPIKDEPMDLEDDDCDCHESSFDDTFLNFSAADVQIKTEKEEEILDQQCNMRPKRKSAIAAIGILNELKTEPGLLSEEENYSNSDIEGGSDEDYNGEDRIPSISMSEESGEDIADKDYKPSSKSKIEKKGIITGSTSIGPKGFRCSECVLSFSQTKELDEHSEETGHVNIKNYNCLLCDKSYYRAVDLKYHRRIHRDNDRTYNCTICKTVLQTYKGYKNHCKSHVGKFFNCTICMTNFISQSKLTAHMNTEHSSQALTCHICGKEFKYHLSLKYHILCHEKKIVTPKGDWKKANKGFNCMECVAAFNLGKELEAHSTETGHVNEKKYICSICQMSYYRRLDLKYHMRKHKNEGKYKCEPCNKTFRKGTDFRSHNRRHTGETFNCTECDKKFVTVRHLKDHMNVHSGKTPYPCNLCELSFTSQPKLGRHKLREHKERKIFDCTLCQMKLTTSSALAYHMYTHTGEKPFKCDTENCTSTFTTKKKLKAHIIRAHSDVEATFQCDLCEKKYKVKDDLIKHRNKHPDKTRSFMCEECGKCYCSKASLKGHQVKHSGHYYNCEQCDKSYFSKQKLDNHVKDVHNKDGYFCELCGLKFKKAKELKIHNQQHKGEKFYECKVCNKKFTRSKNLSVHKRIHAEVRKKFDCDLCGSSYLSKKALRAHQKLHENGTVGVIKERKCHTCQQSFTDRMEYKKHIRAHSTAEKPYQCLNCGNGFTRMDNLKKHTEKCGKEILQL